jgi:PAS domain S-box-containing protein
VAGAEAAGRHAPVRDTDGRIIGGINMFVENHRAQTGGNRAARERDALRTLADHAPVLIWINGPAGCDFVNRSYLDFLGVTMADVQGMGWAKYLHPDDYERYVSGYLAAAEKRALFESALRFRRADGVYRLMRTVGLPHFSPGGDFLGYVGSTYDITDIKMAREPGVFDEYADRLAQGIAAQAAIAIDNARLYAQAKKEIAERKAVEVELQLLNAKLEARIAERTTELVHEINEREKLQVQLLQAQKMESLGVLASGIAHDFNNILNIIQGYAALLSNRPADEAQTSESLKVINETIQRGSGIVQQLLTLARKTESRLEPTDANHLLEGLIKLLKETFPKTIELETKQAPELPAVLADPNQISQALLNLCVNARDAMPSGGRLTLTTELVDSAQLKDGGEEKSGRYVNIEVKDTGMGMDAAMKSRIFEPFFTTKNTGQGTGLGLSVVYGIVKNHNGLISVESKPESGTSFRLYFPVAQSLERPATDEIAETSCETTERPNGHGTILLVEDEKNMLDLLEKTLGRQGYQVLAAADGEKALNIYRRSKEAIDVVMLDLGLPKVAGGDVLLKIKNENPDVKVVIASGYLEPKLKSEIDRAGVKHFLSKPYKPDEVVRTLQSLIEGES